MILDSSKIIKYLPVIAYRLIYRLNMTVPHFNMHTTLVHGST